MRKPTRKEMLGLIWACSLEGLGHRSDQMAGYKGLGVSPQEVGDVE